MTTTAAAAELGAINLQDGNTGFAQTGIGPLIAIVSHHHTGLQGDHIVAVIPLLPEASNGVTAGGDEHQIITIQGRAPLNDPVSMRVMGFTLTLRNNEADFIEVEVDEA